MPGITLQNGLITYYGNPAGYTETNKAVVDRIFQGGELTTWLEGRGFVPYWTDGVMERLIAGEQLSGPKNATLLKNVRIWQLRPEVDVRLKFISYRDMLRQFGKFRPENYRIAYDGQLDTNDLGTIYARLSVRQPPGFFGHPLAMSDVIELYDDSGSTLFYVDRTEFQQVTSVPEESEQL